MPKKSKLWFRKSLNFTGRHNTLKRIIGKADSSPESQFETDSLEILPERQSLEVDVVAQNTPPRQRMKRRKHSSNSSNDENVEQTCTPVFVTPKLSVKKSTPRSKRTYSKRLFMDLHTEPQNMESSFNIEDLEETGDVRPEGRRIISIASLELCMRLAVDHGRNCLNPELRVIREKLSGLKTKIRVCCKFCKDQFMFTNDEGFSSLEINESAAWASNTTGMGYCALEHCLTALDVPFMSRSTFDRYQNGFMEDLTTAWTQLLKENGEEERQLAIQLGQVDEDQIVWTDVYGDGQWSKRCYNQQGSALSGSAVLIGLLTKKPLFVGVRNKFCYVCSTNKGKDHICFKNWEGSSSAMEADIILEGFRCSIASHGLRYKSYVGDGDSSVHKAIEDVYVDNPNGFFSLVQKKQCKNHAIRRLNVNIKAAIRPSPAYSLSHRRLVEKHYAKFGKFCTYAIYHHIENRPATNAMTLKNDIIAIPHHVFGDHSKCSAYFCKDGKIQKPRKYQKEIINDIAEILLTGDNLDIETQDDADACNSASKKEFNMIYRSTMWDTVTKIFRRLADHSISLMYDLTTNITESFNAQVNKFAGGRRTNIVQRGSYNKAIMLSTFGFQNGPAGYVEIHRRSKSIKNTTLSELWKKKYSKYQQIRRTRKKNKSRRRYQQKMNKDSLPDFFSRSRKPVGDAYYGDYVRTIDISDSEVEERIQLLVKNNEVDFDKQFETHIATRGQYKNNMYIEKKKHMITASVCGVIAGLKDSTSNVKYLDSLIDPPDLCHLPAIKWGTDHEKLALKLYEKVIGFTVEEAGLFISTEFSMLGASPDGLVGTDGILEIKCPHIERHMMPEACVRRSTFPLRKLKITTGNDNDSYQLSKGSKYYSQVVMQLHVTNRSWCDFVVWTQGPLIQDNVNGKDAAQNPEGYMIVVRIYRDEETAKKWELIKTKLIRFFTLDYGPEIVDSRFDRNLGYRQPAYRLEAMKKLLLVKEARESAEISTTNGNVGSVEEMVTPTTGKESTCKKRRPSRLFPATDLPKTPRASRAVLKRLGIPNIGDTCYVNAVIQLLQGVKELSTNCSVDTPFHRIIQEYLKATTKKTTKKSLKSLKSRLDKLLPEFSGGQQDAYLFILSIINELDISSPGFRKQFECQFLRKKTCICGNELTNFEEAEVGLSLPITEPQITLQNSLNAYFTETDLTDFACGQCMQTIAKTALQMIEHSSYLLLHIRRFNNDGTKVTQTMDIPEQLIVPSDFMMNDAQSYTFIGLISHIGASILNGHYIFANKTSENFTNYDDSQVYDSCNPPGDTVMLLYAQLRQ